VAEQIGTETTTYVRTFYKFYAAHGLTTESQAASGKAREALEMRG
jgi:hypothetical protein